MAFPTVATSNSGTNAATTTHTLNLPASVAVGDLLIAMFATDLAPTFTWPSGWTELVADNPNGINCKAGARYRIADGTEGASISITTDASEESAYVTLRITGHAGAGTPPQGASVIGNDADPNPPALTPTGGAKDYLWIESYGLDFDAPAATYWSTSYTGIAAPDQGAICCAAAYRQLNAASENPGVMHGAFADDWVAMTMAVHPAEILGGRVSRAFHPGRGPSDQARFYKSARSTFIPAAVASGTRPAMLHGIGAGRAGTILGLHGIEQGHA